MVIWYQLILRERERETLGELLDKEGKRRLMGRCKDLLTFDR